MNELPGLTNINAFGGVTCPLKFMNVSFIEAFHIPNRNEGPGCRYAVSCDQYSAIPSEVSPVSVPKLKAAGTFL